MANIKQQMKRILTNNKQNLANASFKSSLKTAIKNVEVCVSKKNVEEATKAYNEASKKIDKAVAKGFIHKNTAARNKSRLSVLVNSIK